MNLCPRDYLATPLRVARDLVNHGCPNLALAQIGAYDRLRMRLLLPHEVAAVGHLDLARMLLMVVIDLCEQGRDDLAAGPFRGANQALEEATRVLIGRGPGYDY